MFNGEAVAVVGELIPIAAIVLGIGVAMLAMYFEFRKKRELFQLYHAERMAAIEKGIELPALPEEFFKDAGRREPLPARNRRIGLIFLFVGGAVTLALWGSGGGVWWWGLVPVALGLAFLLAAWFEIREQARRLSDQEPSASRAHRI